MRRNPIAILVLAVFVVACDDQPPATSGPPLDLRPISLRIDGPTQVTPGAEVQFTALQTWSDGSTLNVTASAQWTSSNPSVLAISAGLAKAVAGGEVGLTAQVERLISQPKSVRVVPSLPEWDGTYTLTIGGGPCSSNLPFPPELRQRTYTAAVRQFSLALDVSVQSVGSFGGQILNPQVRFFFYNVGALERRVKRAATRLRPSRATDIFTLSVARREPRFYLRSAYWGPPPGFIERLPDSNLLRITGEAIATMSPFGFTGTLNGRFSLYEPARSNLLAVCDSTSHGFTLVRK